MTEADFAYVKNVLRSALKILRNGGWAPCRGALDRDGYETSWIDVWARRWSMEGAVAYGCHLNHLHSLKPFWALREAAGFLSWDIDAVNRWERARGRTWAEVEKAFLRALWRLAECERAAAAGFAR